VWFLILVVHDRSSFMEDTLFCPFRGEEINAWEPARAPACAGKRSLCLVAVTSLWYLAAPLRIRFR
jgi:hypothetical protein